jgi:hypothetical protein
MARMVSAELMGLQQRGGGGQGSGVCVCGTRQHRGGRQLMQQGIQGGRWLLKCGASCSKKHASGSKRVLRTMWAMVHYYCIIIAGFMF